jgi:mannose-1-phosphate guanylyltransferase
MNWAVVLAGGNGSRLQPLTRELTGDDRPKQFCPLLGTRSLLAETLGRLAVSIPVTRTVCVVTREHERYYRSELAHFAPSQIVEQPINRGTAPAIAYGLARVGQTDPNAIVGLFPADHYYEDASPFSRSVTAAFAAARRHPERVFLLGTAPSSAEVEYGWIEPGRPLGDDRDPTFQVTRFWEKPPAHVAANLMARGCLWNMFVLVGSLSAFHSLLYSAAPDLMQSFCLIEKLPSREKLIDQIYAAIPARDFSRDICAHRTHRLGVVRVPDVGWSDLGQPARVRLLLARQTAVSAA